jgi:hypothetical protein
LHSSIRVKISKKIILFIQLNSSVFFVIPLFCICVFQLPNMSLKYCIGMKIREKNPLHQSSPLFTLLFVVLRVGRFSLPGLAEIFHGLTCCALLRGGTLRGAAVRALGCFVVLSVRSKLKAQAERRVRMARRVRPCWFL